MADSFYELRVIARDIGHRLEHGESIGVTLPPKDRRPIDPVSGTTMSDFATKKWIRRANEGMFPAVVVERPVVNPVTLRSDFQKPVDCRLAIIPGFLQRRPVVHA